MFTNNYIYVISWALLIAVLSFLPGSSFPKTEITRADLLVHFFFYATLSYLWLSAQWAKAIKHPSWRDQLRVLIIAIAYSGIIELIQGTEFVSRACELSDFIANSIGCVIGWLVFNVQPSNFRALWKSKNTQKSTPEKNRPKDF